MILFYTNGTTWTFNADSVRVPHKWDKGQLRADGTDRDYRKGKLADDVWQHHSVMPWARERVGYPTQKPLNLLDRIIKASSNPGDMVLDPFCGCATTCVAAENLQRQWVGIDLSPKAGELVMERLGAGETAVRRTDIVLREDIPSRTDLGPLLPYNHPDNKRTLYGQQEGHCAGCGEHFQSRHLEVDHIIAVNKGGTDHIDNLQLLCGNCNRVKGDRGMEYLRTKLQLSR